MSNHNADFRELGQEHLDYLLDIGKGDCMRGVRMLLSKNKRIPAQSIRSADSFIEDYLEHSEYKRDFITVKELYDQYCEYSKGVMGKVSFNRLIESKGFTIINGSGNIRTVLYIKSNWI